MEFDLPAGWALARTVFNRGNDGPVSIFKDPSGKTQFVQVWIMKVSTKPAGMGLQ